MNDRIYLSNIRVSNRADSNLLSLYAIVKDEIVDDVLNGFPMKIVCGISSNYNLNELSYEKYSLELCSLKDVRDDNLIGKLITPVIYSNLKDAPVPEGLKVVDKYSPNISWLERIFSSDLYSFLKIGIDGIKSLEILMSFLSFNEVGNLKLDIRESSKCDEFYMPIFKNQVLAVKNLLDAGNVYVCVSRRE